MDIINALIEEYIRPLATLMTSSDKKETDINLDGLFKLHWDFYTELYNACTRDQRTYAVCEVFDAMQKRFMKEYVEYFLNIERAAKAYARLIDDKRNVRFQRTYESCVNNFKYKNSTFSLDSLLLQPFQRISKYHLLLNELYKHRVDDRELHKRLEHTWRNAVNIGKYLNQAKEDHESVARINELFESLNLAPELESGRLILSMLLFRDEKDIAMSIWAIGFGFLSKIMFDFIDLI